MRCPFKCETDNRSYRNKPVDLKKLPFYSITKSGKTIYSYYECPKCHRIFRKGRRVNKLKETAAQ